MRRIQIALVAGVLAIAGTLGFALDSYAATAATATSGSATNVTSSGATLNGSVNPNGSETSYAFQYGPSTSYGLETAVTSAGSGTTAATVAANLSGLVAGTTYHYRVVAMNAAGAVVGADKTLSTSGTAPTGTTAPAATTGSASSITGTTAIVSGSVNPNGVATSYHYEFGTSTHLGQTTADASAGSGTTAVTASANLSNLPSGTKIYYRVDAVNSQGRVTVGTIDSFTTAATAGLTTGSATGVSSTGVTLTGTVSPAGSATSYYFQYGTSVAYGHVTATVSAGNGSAAVPVTAQVSGLSPSTTYHFRLVGVNAAGTEYGADQTVATSAVASSTLAVYGQQGFVSPGSSIVGVFVACLNGSTDCSGTLSLTRYVTIASRHFTLAPGEAGFVHLTLTAHGVHLMQEHEAQKTLLPTNARISGTKIVHALNLSAWSYDGK